MTSAPLATPRRAFLAGCLCALAAPVAAEPYPARLAFAVIRNGRKIGEQAMTFAPGDSLTVATELEIAVTLGPVSLYRYKHTATERWRGGAFQSLETRTNDNGKMLQVSARREAGGVRIVQPSGAVATGPDALLPFSHWNRAIATAPLFNPQDGKLLKERAQPAGLGVVALADGSSRKAERLVFRGEAHIDDWYDSDGVWTALDSRLKDGSSLVYRRL